MGTVGIVADLLNTATVKRESAINSKERPCLLRIVHQFHGFVIVLFFRLPFSKQRQNRHMTIPVPFLIRLFLSEFICVLEVIDLIIVTTLW